ncbi:MAG: hypothetical protein ABSG05_01765 [Candidatus Pacearchaeota archaeon]|jgi:ribosomal protein L22
MTEKNYNPEQKQNMGINKQQKNQKMQQPAVAKTEKLEKKEEAKPAEDKKTETKVEEKKQETVSKPVIKEKPKKTNAVVNGIGVPISTKQSMAISRFIKRKKIEDAIRDLEQVARLKKPVPMKGEIPHRKGEIMSGRFPQKAAKEFIILLKSLAANSAYNGLENPIITQSVPNIGSRPFGRKGIRRKRTNITIIAEDKKQMVKNK